MKKYITTKENPTFKEGIILNYDKVDFELSTIINGDVFYLPRFDIEIWVERGYIKEEKKKKFTKSDMIDLVKFTDGYAKVVSNEGVVDSWLKQK